MKTDKFEGKHSDITEVVIKCFYEVYDRLRYGFLEKVYANALAHQGREAGLTVEQGLVIPVYFDEIIVGEYHPDLLINQQVIIELKATRSLAPEHEAQLLNYLKATPIEVGLLVNFGPKLEFKRKVFDNSAKGSFSWTNWKPIP